jgi:4-hydroxybenzoate polyprenyltransferase
MTTTTVPAAWQEARPVVQRMFQLRFLTAAALAATTVGAEVRYGRILVAAVAWLLTTWHVYLLNGIADQVEDRCNESRRPIAGGQLPVAEARRILVVLAITAVGLAACVGLPLALLALVMLGLGGVYSAGPWPQKARAAGAMVVVAGGGLTTYLAGWYAGSGGAVAPSPALLLVGGVMTAWMAVAGMTKDLPDVVGDAAAGRRTLPVVLGERRARRLLAALILAVGVTAAAVAIVLGVAVVFGLAVLAGAIAVAAGLAGDDPRVPYRRFMIAQHVAHVVAVAETLI